MKHEIKWFADFDRREREMLSEFRYKRDRIKVHAFFCDIFREQVKHPKKGRKNCVGLDCVEVSTALLYERFSPPMAQKVKVLSRKYGLVRFDGSWISTDLAAELKCSKMCQLWHVRAVEPSLGHEGEEQKLVKAEWDDNDGAVGAAINCIMSAEGVEYGDKCVFMGAKEIVDAYRAGEITFDKLHKLTQACSALKKGVMVKSGCRIFSALTMIPKEFRDHFRDADTFTPLTEICDQPAGQVTDGRVFVALVSKAWERDLGLGRLSDWCDDKAVSTFWNIATGKEKYFYAEFCENCIKQGIIGLEDDHKNKYAKSKKLFMYMANPDAEGTMYNACAWANRKDEGIRVRGYMADSWKAWMAMCQTDRTLAKFILACKLTGFTDAWYRAYTFIEMCVDEVVDGFFAERGYKTFRLHDARYSCDQKLVEIRNREGKEWGQKTQALAVLKKMGMTKFTKDEMQLMSAKATNSRSVKAIGNLVKGHMGELGWALNPFTTLSEERKALIRKALWKMDRNRTYCGEEELLAVAQEAGFDPWGLKHPGREDDFKKKWMYIKEKVA